MNNSRRKFIQSLGMAGIITLGKPEILFAQHINNDSKNFNEKKGLTILFQGDSITDGNRTRNKDWNHVMGHGYQYISSKFWFDYVDKNLMFYNRGISGNRVKDLEERWQTDALDLKPDVLSILVGINDVDAIINNQDPESIDMFELHYKSILEKTKQALPLTQLVLSEPFILPVGRVKEKFESWEKEVSKQQKVIRKLAIDFDAIYVELQQPFNRACKKAPAEYWIWDGIHPMPAGHELIARQWINEVEKKLIF